MSRKDKVAGRVTPASKSHGNARRKMAGAPAT